MKLKNLIPNIVTLINLLAGCIAIVFCFRGNYELVWIFAFIAGVGDVIDGLVARALNAYSELGKQLDSLSDMVSSGVLPGIVMFNLLEDSLFDYLGGSVGENYMMLTILAFPAFLIPMFAAVRLAKFNLEEGQSDYFIGMPTPAGMTFVIGLMMAVKTDSLGLGAMISHPVALYFFTVAIAYLFVANIRVFNLKFKKFQWKGNELRFGYLILCIFLMIWAFGFGEWIGIPLGIVIYILISIFLHFVAKVVKRKEQQV